MVSHSSVKSGPQLRMHPQFDSLFAIWYWGGYVGHTQLRQLLIQMSPLSHKLIKYHFKLVWLIPVLIINLEDYICYIFLFFFCTFGSKRCIIVLNSASSDPESCPVHCQWGWIAIVGLNYLYNHCHILCCCSYNNKTFLVNKIYKIKNIMIVIPNQTFLICYWLFLTDIN